MRNPKSMALNSSILFAKVLVLEKKITRSFSKFQESTILYHELCTCFVQSGSFWFSTMMLAAVRTLSVQCPGFLHTEANTEE